MSDGVPQEEGDAGAPAWVMTFADLMSLLMCFFVLLLSFSEMDVQKYKQLAGSVKQAFGVQREIPAHEIPKGTSVVASEFSPGKPEPTLVNSVRQHTADLDRRKLENPTGAQSEANKVGTSKETEADAKKIAKSLEDEIKSGHVEIETRGKKIIIRILEEGSFASGLADINPNFLPTIQKVRGVMRGVKGKIKVSGHTDDVPIFTDLYRSNWELSAARAVSVVHALTDEDGLDPSRFEVSGLADTKPLAPNDSDANRARNRRVDIVIEQGGEPDEKLDLTKPSTSSRADESPNF